MGNRCRGLSQTLLRHISSNIIYMNNLSTEIINWISETTKSAGFSKVVIGLSGGVDSALSATLAVYALGKEHVYPILLPYKTMHTQAVTDALEVVEFLHIPKENIFQ